MKKTFCRWGILGAAEIARKNWLAIRNAPNCSLVAVASRDIQRCHRFIDECQRHAPFDPPPQAYGSYDELLASDAVDAVYIPLPTGVRKPWAIGLADLLRALSGGGKVLFAQPPAEVPCQHRIVLRPDLWRRSNGLLRGVHRRKFRRRRDQP